MVPSNGSDTSLLAELLESMRAQLNAGMLLAKQGIAAAERGGDGAIQQFFQHCASELERALDGAASLNVAPKTTTDAAPPQPGEQISTAAFAPGDGATDAEVTPEAGRGKAGNWPSY